MINQINQKDDNLKVKIPIQGMECKIWNLRYEIQNILYQSDINT